MLEMEKELSNVKMSDRRSQVPSQFRAYPVYTYFVTSTDINNNYIGGLKLKKKMLYLPEITHCMEPMLTYTNPHPQLNIPKSPNIRTT